MEVTGATFGRSVQWEGDERPLLVPSWLFDIKGGDRAGRDRRGRPGLPRGSAADRPARRRIVRHRAAAVPGSPGTRTRDLRSRRVAPDVEPSASTSRFDSVALVDGGAALRVSFYGGVDIVLHVHRRRQGVGRPGGAAAGREEPRRGLHRPGPAVRADRRSSTKPLGQPAVVDADTGSRRSSARAPTASPAAETRRAAPRCGCRLVRRCGVDGNVSGTSRRRRTSRRRSGCRS